MERGNPTPDIHTDGVRMDRIYYPPDGEKDNCPPDPHDFQRHLKAQTITAEKPDTAPVRTTRHTRCDIPTTTGAPAASRKKETMVASSRKRPRYSRSIPWCRAGQSWTYQYPAAGLLTETTQLQSFDEFQAGFEYDQIGRQVSATVSPGTSYEATRKHEYALVDGTAGTRGSHHSTYTKGIEGQGKKRAHFEPQDGLTQTAFLKGDDTLYSTIDYANDGLGRMVQEKDDLGSTTHVESLPESVQVEDITLGKQSFDGLGRVKNQEVGSRTTLLSYEGSSPKLSDFTIPKKDQAHLVYDPALNYALTDVTTSDNPQSYQYGHHTADMLQGKNPYYTEDLKYLPSGRLASKSIRIRQGTSLSTQYTYSMNGKLQSYSNIHAQSQVLDYDAANRLSQSCVHDTQRDSILTTSLITTTLAVKLSALSLKVQRHYQVSTIFQDGRENITRYTYCDTDPSQLIRITNTHLAESGEIDLQYDANGSLTRDEQGRQLEYDFIGCLKTVRNAQQTTLSQHHYDSRDQLRIRWAQILGSDPPEEWTNGNPTPRFLESLCFRGINPYAYCLGDPINRLDPSGHFSIFGRQIGWRNLAQAVIRLALSILAGIFTEGTSVAIAVGVDVATGIVSDVTTSAVYDAATVGEGIAKGAKQVFKPFRETLDQLLEAQKSCGRRLEQFDGLKRVNKLTSEERGIYQNHLAGLRRKVNEIREREGNRWNFNERGQKYQLQDFQEARSVHLAFRGKSKSRYLKRDEVERCRRDSHIVYLRMMNFPAAAEIGRLPLPPPSFENYILPWAQEYVDDPSWHDTAGRDIIDQRHIFYRYSRDEQKQMLKHVLEEFPTRKLKVLDKAAKAGLVDVVEVLLGLGVLEKTNITDDDEEKEEDDEDAGKDVYPLHNAAYVGQFECVKLMIEKGKMGIESLDEIKATSLLNATSKGHLEIVNWLLEHGASPTPPPCTEGADIIQAAITSGNAAVLEALIAARRKTEPNVALDPNILPSAAASGQEDMLRLVLSLLGYPTPENREQLTQTQREGLENVLWRVTEKGSLGAVTLFLSSLPATKTALSNATPSPKTNMQTPIEHGYSTAQKTPSNKTTHRNSSLYPGKRFSVPQ
ncbi:hypothetical protein G7Y89_g14930 [Cudoniella acicularis]|uniref:Uncharacterized protein n=1 Tax=Cudoniella acicularis TaxID=354080 RepID=A0A8H4VQ96_9HELO|nr:hypothetical protein G7Y89_g14930 [Cudoniella acicularis]